MKRHFFTYLLIGSLAVGASAQKAAKADGLQAELRRHVEYLASDKLEGRRAGEAGATLAAGYVANQFAKIKLKPGVRMANGKAGFLQEFSYTPVRNPHATAADPAKAGTPNERVAFNVIGILEGRDASLKNEAIVIGAHYDHLGKGGPGSLAADSTDVHHGADDNASGTAAVIELARRFAKDKSNKRTIIFIAFSGEEDGLFGSKFYVSNPAVPLDRTVAMINLDMVGRMNDCKVTIGGMGTSAQWQDMVAHANRPTVSTSTYDALPNRMKASGTAKIIPHGCSQLALGLNEDGFGPSDHSSFYGKNIPVLFFFTGTHLDYHKPSDTSDKVNYAGVSQIVNFVSSIAKAIDQDPTRPTYTVAKSATPQGARTGFSISLGTIPTYADSTDGMLLDGVRENSPAAKAGLKAGDKIVKLAGKDIKNVYDYTAAMGEMKPDVEYDVVIIRGAETMTLKVTPAKRP